MNQSRNPQRTVLIASFCLGIALGIFRLIVDLAYLEPEVELYRRGSVPPVILKVLLCVCVVLALLTVFVVRKKDQGLTLNNSGTVLSFLALLLALLMSKYGFRFSRPSDALRIAVVLLLPILAILLEKETGSALVYLGFLIVCYREGMT
ncbi:MAG: hypothetical protein J5494_01405, partial [Candidatus Methanomethylophilaceae archaeon]|nr:hypothetical protein [Candidatus Methanomethylophilaceae archaeon]